MSLSSSGSQGADRTAPAATGLPRSPLGRLTQAEEPDVREVLTSTFGPFERGEFAAMATVVRT